MKKQKMHYLASWHCEKGHFRSSCSVLFLNHSLKNNCISTLEAKLSACQYGEGLLFYYQDSKVSQSRAPLLGQYWKRLFLQKYPAKPALGSILEVIINIPPLSFLVLWPSLMESYLSYQPTCPAHISRKSSLQASCLTCTSPHMHPHKSWKTIICWLAYNSFYLWVSSKNNPLPLPKSNDMTWGNMSACLSNLDDAGRMLRYTNGCTL